MELRGRFTVLTVAGVACLLSSCGASSRDADTCRQFSATSNDIILSAERDPIRIETYQLVGGQAMLGPAKTLASQAAKRSGQIDDELLRVAVERIGASAPTLFQSASDGFDGPGAVDALEPFVRATQLVLFACDLMD